MNILAQRSPPQQPLPEPPLGSEQRLLLHNISWQDYQTIGDILRDRPSLRLTYDRGSLEFMTTSSRHEVYKRWLSRLVEALAEELNIPIAPGGNVTLKREVLERGLEPDDCFWIANERRVRGKLDLDFATDPPPDIVLEIEVSRSALNRMDLYAALGIPEVWRFDGQTLQVHVLQPDRTYQAVERSPTFSLVPPAEIVRFLQPSETQDYLSVIRSFRTWVREQLARKEE